MRRLVGVALLLAAASVPAAGGAPGAALSLTFAVQVQFGGGTGFVISPVALCDTGTDGTSLRRLSDRLGSFDAPAWSRDGSKLAFTAYDPVKRRFSIQVTPAGSWSPVTIARSTKRLDRPSWSPDGTRVAYASNSGKDPGIYSVKPDGSGNRRLYAGTARAPAWSPDGTRIAFEANGIRVVSADGSNVQTINADGLEPAWSADGTKIAYVSKASQFGDQELFTMAADGTGPARLTKVSPSPNGGTTYLGVPAWAPDGSVIAVEHTVQHNFGKGDYFARDLLLVDPSTGTAASVNLPLVFGDPAWRTVPPPTRADAAKRPCAILAGDGGVKVDGTAYDDLIVTGAGNDTVDGGAGNDWIEASTGDDRVTGGLGRDEIWSGPGTDRELVRDGARDLVHCGDFARDLVEADKIDVVAGRCRAVNRR
jgi:dipeptidyl aminopeptidase/acylaminoacyl peptidase